MVQGKVVDLKNASKWYNIHVSGIQKVQKMRVTLKPLLGKLLRKLLKLNIDLNLYTGRIYRTPLKYTSQNKTTRHTNCTVLKYERKRNLTEKVISSKIKTGLTPDYVIVRLGKRLNWKKFSN
jgi:hypothetical protein